MQTSRLPGINMVAATCRNCKRSTWQSRSHIPKNVCVPECPHEILQSLADMMSAMSPEEMLELVTPHLRALGLPTFENGCIISDETLEAQHFACAPDVYAEIHVKELLGRIQAFLYSRQEDEVMKQVLSQLRMRQMWSCCTFCSPECKWSYVFQFGPPYRSHPPESTLGTVSMQAM